MLQSRLRYAGRALDRCSCASAASRTSPLRFRATSCCQVPPERRCLTTSVQAQAVCSIPVPEVLGRPLEEFPTCSQCSKVFANMRGLTRHASVCDREFGCGMCFRRFASERHRDNHERLHEARRESFACEVCGQKYLQKHSLKKHLAENPGPHAAVSRPQLINISEADVSGDVFSGMTPVLHGECHHVTNLESKSAIMEERLIRANRASIQMSLDGVLLRDDHNTPVGAHFAVVPETLGVLPITSFVPSTAEPGEVLARVSLDLNDLLRQNSRVYLASLGYESSRRRSAVRVTLLFAREEDVRWADEHCFAKLDPFDNPIAQCARTSGSWEIATVFHPATLHRTIDGMSTPSASVAATGENSETSRMSPNAEHSIMNDGELSRDQKTSEPDSNQATVGSSHEAACGSSDAPQDNTEQTHKLNVTIVVAGGVRLDAVQPEWRRVFRTDREKGVLYCPVCECEQRNYAELNHHISRVHQDRRLQCPDCEKTFRWPSRLTTHINFAHKGIGHECKRCDAKFESAALLREHVSVQHDGIRIPCPECDVEVDSKRELERHKQKVHLAKSNVCKICDKQFSSRANLRSHERAEHEGRKFRCDKCAKVYRSKDGLKKHISSAHEAILFKCSRCPKSYKQKWNLDKHFKVQHEDFRYACSVCAATFRSATVRNIHEKSNHEGLQLDCVACSATFSSSSARLRHIQAVHPSHFEAAAAMPSSLLSLSETAASRTTVSNVSQSKKKALM